jgi:uncharacterized protein YbaR (Trm112 family)
MDTRLLELLVCPLCKGPLEHQRPPFQPQQELICRADRLAFPVRDGMPVMLESEARSLDAPTPSPETTP